MSSRSGTAPLTLADILSAHPRFWWAANHCLLSLMAVVSYLQQPLGRKSHSLLQKLISSPKLLARDSSLVLDRILLTEDEKRSPTPNVPRWDVNPLWLHILPPFFLPRCPQIFSLRVESFQPENKALYWERPQQTPGWGPSPIFYQSPIGLLTWPPWATLWNSMNKEDRSTGDHLGSSQD